MMPRFVTRSVRNKLALIVAGTAFGVLVLAGIALVIYDLRNYRESGLSDLATQAEIVGRASAPALAFEDPKTASEYLRLLRAKPNIVAAAIYNARGRLFASYTRRDLDIALPRLPEAEGAYIEGRSLVTYRRIVDNNEILGTVYLKGDYEVMARLMGYLGIFGSVAVLSLVVALVVSGRAQAVVTKPIMETAAVARNVVESRDFSQRVTKSTEDEIGQLVDAFNGMLAEVGRRAEAIEESNRSLEREVAQRQQADQALRDLNVDLERRIESRTAQLEAANKELEGFSYSVSHDLRAPLRAILGFARMLQEDHGEKLDPEARRKLDVIQNEAQRMGVLIDDLLAFSRLGRKAMQFAEFDMTELARTTYDGLNGHHDGPRADFRLSTLPRAKGDRVLLGQVWANLLSNAMKFSSKREKPVIEVSSISDDKEHVYFVRDNGAGFDPRYQSKLFGVFQRLHDASQFAGTGVGLALVQRIVTRHGGRVWADSKPDAGATFYFTLPKESTHGSAV